MVLRVLVLAVLLSVPVSPAKAACYIAYIHGKTGNLSPGVATDTERRNYWRNGAADTYGDFVLWSGINPGCAVLVAGYDGQLGFWEAGAAGAVAGQLNAFIQQWAIPDGQLILVAHSMGGLVARWIANNGVGGSAYYNYNGDYASIVRKTKYVIAIASPHLGSPAADAVYGTADTLCGNFVGTIAGWLGQRTNATYWLTQIQLEYASASGSWMGDAGRYRTLYTMATRRWDSGNGMLEDQLLSGAWDCLGYVHHWYVPWRDDVPGDGLVFETSGAGQYRESGLSSTADWGTKTWSKGQWVQGARRDWVHMNHDHHHARLDDQSAALQDNIRGVSTSYWPGSYIRYYGLSLQ
jgi:pimeloyl-ACP methyl ester carboxylesterase